MKKWLLHMADSGPSLAEVIIVSVICILILFLGGVYVYELYVSSEECVSSGGVYKGGGQCLNLP